LVAATLWVSPASGARAQGRIAGAPLDALEQLNGSVEALVSRVSASVVQVLVTSYGPVDEHGHDETDLVIARQHSMGSGVVVGSEGYIMTNAHVVNNARRVQVVLPSTASDGMPELSLAGGRGRTVEATVVGVAREIDLALLRVDATGLPVLPMADYDKLRQGELVFAFGSPEGLRNSVTMGIVSAVARQTDPDSPLVYVQTDAPINHGNSGGPLVNVRGELVGIDAFTLSQSSDSQGLGFAIPSALVQLAYPQLRKWGHLHRGEIGILLQTITPTLANGLGLTQDWGALVSDVRPESPAALAGLRVRDIVVSIDGQAVDGVPRLSFQLFTRSAGDRVRLGVRRGSEGLAIEIQAREWSRDFDQLTDLVTPETSLVPRLGILGLDLNDKSAPLRPALLRVASGVIVVGHAKGEADAPDTSLITGDIIHSVNGGPIASVDDLKAALDGLKPRSSVVIQIERNGQLSFLAFELD
jgi:serine protease Do